MSNRFIGSYTDFINMTHKIGAELPKGIEDRLTTNDLTSKEYGEIDISIQIELSYEFKCAGTIIVGLYDKKNKNKTAGLYDIETRESFF